MRSLTRGNWWDLWIFSDRLLRYHFCTFIHLILILCGCVFFTIIIPRSCARPESDGCQSVIILSGLINFLPATSHTDCTPRRYLEALPQANGIFIGNANIFPLQPRNYLYHTNLVYVESNA